MTRLEELLVLHPLKANRDVPRMNPNEVVEDLLEKHEDHKEKLNSKIEGTGLAEQVALWTGPSTLAGDPDLTFAGGSLTVARHIFFPSGSNHVIFASQAPVSDGGRALSMASGSAVGPGNFPGGNLQFEAGHGTGTGAHGNILIALDGGGFVGIGLGNPDTLLHVFGSAKIAADLTIPTLGGGGGLLGVGAADSGGAGFRVVTVPN